MIRTRPELSPKTEEGAVVLENDLLRVVVLPDVGGMIYRFIHKPSGHDLLYHHPRLDPRRAYYRAPVDDWWTGGMIEGLPTCFPCTVEDQSIPDFGEVWSEPWSVIDASQSSATLSCTTRIWPLRITRQMSLRDGEACLRLRYAIENLGATKVPFLWGVHPTVPVGPHTMMQLPARLEHLTGDGGTPIFTRDSEFAAGPTPYTQIAAPWQRFSYLTDLPDHAWYAVWDEAWPAGFGMSFSGSDFPSVGLWLLNGWRGLQAITLEPWIGWPGSLAEAISLDRAPILTPNGRFETTLSMVAFTPPGPIGGFDPQGRPLTA